MSALEDMLRWIPIKIKLQDKFDNKRNTISKNFTPAGSIYTCHLGQNVGFEKSKLQARPCVIISNDTINKNSGNVIVIPLTSTIKRKSGSNTALLYKTHYVLQQSSYSFLKNDSAVCCEDIRSISKARLGKYIGSISKSDLENIRKRLKYALQF